MQQQAYPRWDARRQRQQGRGASGNSGARDGLVARRLPWFNTAGRPEAKKDPETCPGPFRQTAIRGVRGEPPD
jgi:hypothetical protein